MILPSLKNNLKGFYAIVKNFVGRFRKQPTKVLFQ